MYFHFEQTIPAQAGIIFFSEKVFTFSFVEHPTYLLEK